MPKPHTRYDHNRKKQVAHPKVDAFLAEIDGVCQKHGMSIGHEDTHGAFIVRTYSEDRANWLADAAVKLDG